MDIGTLNFFIFCMIAIIIWMIFRPYHKLAPYLLIIINACFAATAAGSLQALIPVAAFIMFGYVLLILLDRAVIRGWMVVVALIGLFAYVRRYDILSSLPQIPSVYSVIGLSYVLFRILHLALERDGGAVERRPGVLDYLNYVTFFPAWLSGPIQRYEDFKPGTALSQSEALDALDRITLGAAKMLVVSALFSLSFDSAAQSLQSHESDGVIRGMPIHAWASACFFLRLYFNFSGSMDIVIGIAGLMGFRLPENFNKPWQAANIQDFWSRWHITLSEWFKSYLFNPILQSLGRSFGSTKRMPYLAVVAFFMTFLVMGIWHGTSWVMVLYGVVLGAGVSANKLYEIWLKKRLGKQRQRQLASHPLYKSAANGLTLAYLALGMTFLWESPQSLSSHLTPLGIFAIILEWLGLAVLVYLTGLIAPPALGLAKQWRERLSPQAVVWREMMFSVKAFAVVVAAYLLAVPTGTIYKGF